MAKKKEQKDMAQEQEQRLNFQQKLIEICLLYTSDAADD